MPLYVGLMSQVHRGVLFDNYHKVIVKIKPAHIDTQSVWDIWYINQFTKLILLVLPDKHKDNI